MNVRGSKYCKCNGGRGKYGTRCYDDPKFCCKKQLRNKEK